MKKACLWTSREPPQPEPSRRPGSFRSSWRRTRGVVDVGKHEQQEMARVMHVIRKFLSGGWKRTSHDCIQLFLIFQGQYRADLFSQLRGQSHSQNIG